MIRLFIGMILAFSIAFGEDDISVKIKKTSSQIN